MPATIAFSGAQNISAASLSRRMRGRERHEKEHRSHSDHPCRQPVAAGGPHRDQSRACSGGKQGRRRLCGLSRRRPSPTWCASSASSASIFPTTASSASRWRRTTITAYGGITRSREWQGFSPAETRCDESEHKKSSVAELALTSFANRRDWQKFGEFYQDPESSGSLMGSAARRRTRRPVCTAPIKYTGQAAIAADIANLKKALAAAGADEGFMCSIGPGSFARGEDLFYKTEEEFVFAAAEAMRRGIQGDRRCRHRAADRRSEPAGQLGHDQSGAAARANSRNSSACASRRSITRCAACRRNASATISAGAAGTARIPPTFRLTTSSTSCSRVNAGAYSVEAGNVRHEHEWRVWQDVKLPDGKLLIPGVVSHATNIVEHPQVVADRIAPLCGRGRPRERHCRNRLRIGRPHPSADRLGETRSAGRGRQAGEPGAVAIDRRGRLFSERSCVVETVALFCPVCDDVGPNPIVEIAVGQ